MNSRYDIYVFTANTDHGDDIPYPGIVTGQWLFNKETGARILYVPKKKFSRRQLQQVINGVNPDYLYINLLFSPLFAVSPLWLKLTGKITCKVLVCPRGCLYESALSKKTQQKKLLLRFYNLLGMAKKVTFHATNEREQQAVQKYFPGAQTIVANNLPEMEQPAFVSCAKKTGVLRCIFIARIVPIKNLLFLLEVLQAVKASVQLTIAGPVEDENYWMQCKTLMQQLPKNISCNYIGPQSSDKLDTLIQQHHLFVLPTTGENFGHAIFESLLVGRPVLISDQTPWLHLEEAKAGWHLPLQQKEKFIAVIEETAALNQAEFDSYAMNAWQFARKFINGTELIKPYYHLFS